METKRTPEMEELLQKSRELNKIFRTEKTEQALEKFKEVERQRYKQYYRENRESEIKRVSECKKNKGFINCTCGLAVPKHHHNDHVQTKLHFKYLESKNPNTF